MRNAAPAFPSTAVILKFRIMFSMARPAAFALSTIASVVLIVAVRAACANMTIRANATCAPLTPIITPVRMAFPTFAHVIARSLVYVAAICAPSARYVPALDAALTAAIARACAHVATVNSRCAIAVSLVASR